MRPAISSNERESSPISSLRVEWVRVASSPRPNWSTSRRKRRSGAARCAARIQPIRAMTSTIAP